MSQTPCAFTAGSQMPHMLMQFRTTAVIIPLFLLVFLTQLETGPAHAGSERVMIWLEAEHFTSATQGIRFVSCKDGRLCAQDEYIDIPFLKRSGWDVDTSQRVSGDGYIEQAAGQRLSANLDDRSLYDFQVPEEDSYYFWIRMNSPPPLCAIFQHLVGQTFAGDSRG